MQVTGAWRKGRILDNRGSGMLLRRVTPATEYLLRNCPEDHHREIFEPRHPIVRTPVRCAGEFRQNRRRLSILRHNSFGGC